MNEIQAFCKKAFDESITEKTKVYAIPWGISNVEVCCDTDTKGATTQRFAASMFPVGRVAVGYSPETDTIFYSERDWCEF